MTNACSANQCHCIRQERACQLSFKHCTKSSRYLRKRSKSYQRASSQDIAAKQARLSRWCWPAAKNSTGGLLAGVGIDVLRFLVVSADMQSYVS